MSNQKKESSKGSRPEMSWVESRGMYRKRIKLGMKTKDVYGKTKDEVREIVKQLQRDYEIGLTLDNTTTFGVFSTKWYHLKSAHIRKSTQYNYLGVLSKNLC